MPNPFLVDDGAAQQPYTPDANHAALFDAIQKQTQISQQRQQLENITPPNLSDQSQQQPGGVKRFFMGYLDQVGRNLSGRPSAFEEQQAQIKNQIAAQNAQSEATLRQAQGRYYDDRNSTAENVANTRVSGVLSQVNQKLADSGYEMVPDANGVPQMQAIPKERLSEKARSGADLNDARSAYQQAAAAKAKADADVKMNPNNPTFLQNQKKIEAELAMAQQRINLAVMGNTRQNAQFEINNGVKPDGSPAAIQGSGQLIGENGQPVGKNFQTLNAPTASSKTMGEMATTVIPHLDHLSKTVDANAADMGPLMGRWSTAMIQGIKSTGDDAKDQRLNEMLTEMKLMTSAIARTHFGGKTGPQAAQYFNGLLDAAKTPAGIKGVLEAARPYMVGYKEMGTPKTNTNAPKGATHVYVPGKGITAIGK